MVLDGLTRAREMHFRISYLYVSYAGAAREINKGIAQWDTVPREIGLAKKGQC